MAKLFQESSRSSQSETGELNGALGFAAFQKASSSGQATYRSSSAVTIPDDSDSNARQSNDKFVRLRRQIAAYEQAVGKAILYQRRMLMKHPQNSFPWDPVACKSASSLAWHVPQPSVESCDVSLHGQIPFSGDGAEEVLSMRQQPQQFGNTIPFQVPQLKVPEYSHIRASRKDSHRESNVSCVTKYVARTSDGRPEQSTSSNHVEAPQHVDVVERVPDEGRALQHYTDGRHDHLINHLTGWSHELDEQLRAEVYAQQSAGIASLQWTKIAKKLKIRSGSQCQARWVEVLDERISKGRWSVEEDKLLLDNFAFYGSQWSKIASEMKSRTQRQCRSRWLQIRAASVEHHKENSGLSNSAFKLDQ